MTKVDLITGFLGSGKTTFLKQYLSYLLSKGERICVLEFDYGAVNVDMMLLQEFNNLIDIEMVQGGCDHSCHLRRFKTKMIAMGMKRYDRVIIEPSGIFDIDEFFDTIYDEPLPNWYEIGSVISIVDSTLDLNLSKEEEYILTSQIGSSGVIILSKTQNITEEQKNDFMVKLQSIMENNSMSLSRIKIITKNFKDYTTEDYIDIQKGSYSVQEHEKIDIMNINHFSSIYFLNLGINYTELCKKVQSLFTSEYGKIIRIKGFIKEDSNWYEINFTKDNLSSNIVENGQDVIIVIGENLKEEKIKSFITKQNS